MSDVEKVRAEMVRRHEQDLERWDTEREQFQAQLTAAQESTEAHAAATNMLIASIGNVLDWWNIAPTIPDAIIALRERAEKTEARLAAAKTALHEARVKIESRMVNLEENGEDGLAAEYYRVVGLIDDALRPATAKTNDENLVAPR